MVVVGDKPFHPPERGPVERADEPSEGGGQQRRRWLGMVVQGHPGELQVGQDACLRVGEDDFRDRQGCQSRHRGQEIRLPPYEIAPAFAHGLLARPDYEVAVDLVDDVVLSFTQPGHRHDLEAGEVPLHQQADVVPHARTLVGGSRSHR